MQGYQWYTKDSYKNDTNKRQGMVDIITTYINQEHMWVHTWNRTKFLSLSTAYIYDLQSVT